MYRDEKRVPMCATSPRFLRLDSSFLSFSLPSPPPPFKLIHSILMARYAHAVLLFGSCKLSVLINESRTVDALWPPTSPATSFSPLRRDFVQGFRVTGERRHLPRRWYLEVSNYGRYTSFYLRDALNGSTHPPTSPPPPSLSRTSTPSMDDSNRF